MSRKITFATILLLSSAQAIQLKSKELPSQSNGCKKTVWECYDDEVPYPGKCGCKGGYPDPYGNPWAKKYASYHHCSDSDSESDHECPCKEEIAALEDKLDQLIEDVANIPTDGAPGSGDGSGSTDCTCHCNGSDGTNHCCCINVNCIC